MNNCDERIEKTLNRAGQTFDESRDYTHDETMSAMSMPFLELVMKYLECVRLIDTMETALENVCGELDYLKYRLNWLSLYTHRDCPSCERLYECERTPDHCLGWVFSGIPDGWRTDDETSNA